MAISHLGVQFIDIETQGTICEHSVKNIDCACQDADDLSHFAYITKDLENNTHYCHVFNVDSMVRESHLRNELYKFKKIKRLQLIKSINKINEAFYQLIIELCVTFSFRIWQPK